MAEQLTLGFTFEPGMGEENFLVSLFNAQAASMIGRWPLWPDQVLVLCGPEGCGKTHLASIWAKKSNATTISAHELHATALDALREAQAIVIEDMDRGQAGLDEPTLFHLLNLARQNGIHILLTARSSPDCWNLSTPDLVSRLRLAPLVVIDHPDDALFRGLIAKLLHDRQLLVEPQVIEYLVLRCERSFVAARMIVEQLDRSSLAQGRRITRAVAAEALLHLEAAADAR